MPASSPTAAVTERFGLSVHPCSGEWAFARREVARGPSSGARSAASWPWKGSLRPAAGSRVRAWRRLCGQRRHLAPRAGSGLCTGSGAGRPCGPPSCRPAAQGPVGVDPSDVLLRRARTPRTPRPAGSPGLVCAGRSVRPWVAASVNSGRRPEPGTEAAPRRTPRWRGRSSQPCVRRRRSLPPRQRAYG